MNDLLYTYHAALTADLPSLYTTEAFCNNQVLPLIAEQSTAVLSQHITYYIQEIDKLETIPAYLLKFRGYELIDEEHYFYFFEIDEEKLQNKFKVAQRVLRATIALVSLQGETRMLVQLVEAITEADFASNHQLITSHGQTMAG